MTSATGKGFFHHMPHTPSPTSLHAEHDWRARAAAVVPSGASTGSKRPDALYGPGPHVGPTHFVRSSGCRVVTTEGRALVDCTMALGTVALGYADPAVTEAVVRAARSGNVSGLSHVLEVEIAERLCAVIPCAERVRFLKSGAEAVAAAIRIARAHTGRDTILGAGYFGWLDWWSEGRGIPANAHADFHAVPHNDVAALHEAVRRTEATLAAILIEPVVERMPAPEWIDAARHLCDQHGAVLIFDEIKTGFRLRPGGYAEYAGVRPDLALFGKAMANGYPLSAVVGSARIMDAARSTWISSTLAGESTALAAVGAVLDRHAAEPVTAELSRIGEVMRGIVSDAIAASGYHGAVPAGIEPMWFLRFSRDSQQARFLELALERDVLFKRGAYNFAALAHDAPALEAIREAATHAFARLCDEEELALHA